MTSPFEEKGNGNGSHVRRKGGKEDQEWSDEEDLGDTASEGANGDGPDE